MQGEKLWSLLSREPDIVDAGVADVQQEWANYFTRQRLLAEIVKGEMHPDDLLDCMIDQGMSPDVYLDEVEDDLREFVG
jgi:hypothetical protein